MDDEISNSRSQIQPAIHRIDGELALLTPDFDWKRYISTVGIPHVESLNVAAPDFVKSLNMTLRDTSLADIKTYLTWHVLLSNAELLPSAFEAEDFRFFEHILRGTEAIAPRWKRCVRSADRALGEALGQEFVKVAFSGASKEKALALVGQIETEMRKDIELVLRTAVASPLIAKQLMAVHTGEEPAWKGISQYVDHSFQRFAHLLEGAHLSLQCCHSFFKPRSSHDCIPNIE